MSNDSEKSVNRQAESPELAALDAKVNALLPPRYQYCFEAVNPKSMGSAALKYDPEARVAWDQIWTHFCDLALAGGPPHRGTLLETPTPNEVEAEPAGYQLVCDEIVRGIRMTSGLVAKAGPEPGWVTVECHSLVMAEWLLRAVMAENVFARRRDHSLQVPAGPTFRLVKEVKNIVVALAKTGHYWKDHLSEEQRSQAENLFAAATTATLLEPPCRPEVLKRVAEYHDMTQRLGQALFDAVGLPVVKSVASGWIGIRLQDERMAAWFVRSAIAENILARREQAVLFLPVPLTNQLDMEEIVERMVRLLRIWTSLPRSEHAQI